MRTFATLMILFALGAFFLAGVAALFVLGTTAYPTEVAPGQAVPVEAYAPAVPAAYAAPGVTWITILFQTLVPLTLVALFGLVFIVVAMRLVGHRPHRAKAHEAIEETRLIQELYHGMSRMEERIESLETLLLDRAAPPEFLATEPRRHTGAR